MREFDNRMAQTAILVTKTTRVCVAYALFQRRCASLPHAVLPVMQPGICRRFNPDEFTAEYAEDPARQAANTEPRTRIIHHGDTEARRRCCNSKRHRDEAVSIKEG
jgi:hypothetical protein